MSDFPIATVPAPGSMAVDFEERVTSVACATTASVERGPRSLRPSSGPSSAST